MQKRLTIVILITSLFSSYCFADDNIESVTSPNGRWVAYVKKSSHIVSEECADFAILNGPYANEIWIRDLKSMKKRLLVRDNFSCYIPMKKMIDPQDLNFSPDSKTLYFSASAWTTSGAIHAVNVINGHEWFVTDGNEYSVVMNGKYTGDLIVNQHRYHDEGGSYDWYWLFTPSGKQIKLYAKED
jgi:hypothetical protein